MIEMIKKKEINRCHPGKFNMRVKMMSQKKQKKVKINNMLDHVANKLATFV